MTAFFGVCWDILVDSSIWMFFGFFMAGLLRAFVPSDLVARHLGRNGSGSVFKAALFGVPLPLCSCGVIPAAAGLRRQGASRGATASFLVSTPETGVDSMAVSWALLDPVMTVVRPLAAFVTAIVTGLVIDAADREPAAPSGLLRPLTPMPVPPAPTFGEVPGACCGSSCSCGSSAEPKGVWSRFLEGQRFAFDDLMADIAPWFSLGILVAACITILLPADLGALIPGGKAASMLVLLAVSLPMYVCATASTPIAAALALKGFSPGALLVFLLAGPATNAATIVMVGRMLGRKSAVIYVCSIIVATLACAVAVDALYAWLGIGVHAWLADSGAAESGVLSVLAAVVMLASLARYSVRLAVRRLRAARS